MPELLWNHSNVTKLHAIRQRVLFQSIFGGMIFCGVWFVFCTSAHAQAPQQILGILSYIEGDYRVAVNDQGQLLNQGEYEEQKFLLEQAMGLLPGEASDLQPRFLELKKAIELKAPPSTIQEGCRAIKAVLMQRFALTLTPPRPSDWKRAAELFRTQGCTACHGSTGKADGPQSASFKPPPANFHDPKVMQDISPLRAYHAITHGIAGTAMVGFTQLSEADRWALARYIVAWRHTPKDAAKGAALVAREPNVLMAHKSPVYQSDTELLGELRANVNDAATQRQVVAYIRRVVEFNTGNTDFAVLRSRIGAGLKAYNNHDFIQAKTHFIAAYLDGFEPYESSLKLAEPAKVQRVERAMLRLQQLAAQEGKYSELVRTTSEVERIVSEMAQAPSSRNTSFFAALLIALREGVEGVLLIAVLLGMARKREEPALQYWIHGGWLSALVCGLITWFVLADILSGMARELAEGIVALLAAVMLLGVTHWMLGQLTAKRWVGLLMRWWEQSTDNVSSKAAIFVLSFISVYREAFEVVLFFKALVLEAGNHQQWVWMGALSGILALGVIAMVMRAISQRLPLRQFMLASSSLLALLTVVLVGNGVHSLQEAGVISYTSIACPEIPAMGVYASLESLGAQAAMTFVVALVACLPLYYRWRDANSTARTLPGT